MNDTSISVINNDGRDFRLDIIKAISISFVFIWHIHPIKPNNEIVKFVMSVIMKNFLLIAVPSFITVSLMLFHKKILL